LVDIEKDEGPKCKVPEKGISRNYFAKEKLVDQVHESVDRAGPVHHGPAATATLRSSPELGLRPLHGSRSPGKGWRTGNLLRASPEHGRRRGGRATEGNGGGGQCSVRWGCGLRNEQRRVGVSVMMAGGAPHPFIGAGRRGGGEMAGSNGLNAIEGEAA
jgi:hypothetical protein